MSGIRTTVEKAHLVFIFIRRKDVLRYDLGDEHPSKRRLPGWVLGYVWGKYFILVALG